jgi:predicted nucleic acid-binding protein
MTVIVLDASAALDLLLGTNGSHRITEALESAESVAAPRLYAAEVANALWKYVRAGHLDESVALDRLRDALALVEHPVDDGELAVEALQTAIRFAHPVYDALYAVLARRLAAAVLTEDERLRALLADLRLDAL